MTFNEVWGIYAGGAPLCPPGALTEITLRQKAVINRREYTHTNTGHLHIITTLRFHIFFIIVVIGLQQETFTHFEKSLYTLLLFNYISKYTSENVLFNHIKYLLIYKVAALYRHKQLVSLWKISPLYILFLLHVNN